MKKKPMFFTFTTPDNLATVTVRISAITSCDTRMVYDSVKQTRSKVASIEYEGNQGYRTRHENISLSDCEKLKAILESM